MNDNRQIAAVSWHFFNFCSLKLWSYCTDLHQNLHDVEVFADLENNVALCFEMPEQKVKTINFDVCKKAPKLIGYHSNVSLTTAKLFQFNNLHTWAYQCWKFGEVWSSTCWYIGMIYWFFRLVPKGTETTCTIFRPGVSGPIFTKIVQNVAKFVPFNKCKSELRYPNLLQNASVLNKSHFTNFAQNRLPRQRP